MTFALVRTAIFLPNYRIFCISMPVARGTMTNVHCATKNAKANGIENARFLCADAGDAEALFASVKKGMGEDYRPSGVILDPPRKGSTPDLLTYLANTLRVPKILYISCNPDTLARDAKILCDHGYTMSEVTPVDLFPRTGHVESVVCLTRS